MKADVIVIGPFARLKKADVLDYFDNDYPDAEGWELVCGTIVRAETAEQSRELADVCNVDDWDLLNHRVTSVGDFEWGVWIGDKLTQEIAKKIKDLIHEDTFIFYRPNA